MARLRFTGSELLDMLDIKDEVLIFTRRWPRAQHQPGDAVPIIERDGRPYYCIRSKTYQPPILIEAVRTKNPALIDSGQRKLHNTLTARDMEMYERLKRGDTYADIGQPYGLTRERVRQIAKKLASKGYETHTKTQRRKAKEAAQVQLFESKYGAKAAEIFADTHLRKALTIRLRNKRNHAQAMGIPFDITMSDLHPVPTVCPVLDIPIHFGAGRNHDNSLSIDRIDPSGGYTKGNVVLVSNRANRIKNDASPDELRRIADFYSGLTKSYGSS